jgi:hypothetical protein
MSTSKGFRYWSHHQQLLGKRGTTLEQVLNDIIGVYSSHPSGPLSLFTRVKSFSEKAFHKLEEDRAAIRVPAMRQSVYMLPVKTARLAVAATIPPTNDPYWAKRYAHKKREIPPNKYKIWRTQIAKCAKRPLSAAEIKEHVDIPAGTIKTVLNRMAFEGSLLRVGTGTLRANTLSYVATRSWAKEHRLPVGSASDDEPLEWLAGEYLRAFGPARVKDFQWWAGITAGKAKKAMAAHKTVLVADQHLLLAKDVKKFQAFKKPKKDTLDILPQCDCYTMGYAPDGRERFVDPEDQGEVYVSIGATGGNALGVVLVNGLAHGSWTSRFKGDRMSVSLNMFARPTPPRKRKITDKFNEIATLMGATSMVLEKQ